MSPLPGEIPSQQTLVKELDNIHSLLQSYLLNSYLDAWHRQRTAGYGGDTVEQMKLSHSFYVTIKIL
jgi:hypothetical protein